MSKKLLNINICESYLNKENSEGNENRYEKKNVLLGEDEYPIIYKDHPITDEEFEDAIDIIVTHAMQRQIHTVNVDLDVKSKIVEERNKPLEITLEELSHFFGGREIVIVGKKEETMFEPGEDNGK